MVGDAGCCRAQQECLDCALALVTKHDQVAAEFSGRVENFILSAARFFLFGSRDVWFVVGLPVFLYSVLGWSFMQVGGYLALWVIGYGLVQASAPKMLHHSHQGRGPDGGTARFWVFALALFPTAIALALQAGLGPGWVLVIGLVAFGVVFAINSAVHSYPIFVTILNTYLYNQRIVILNCSLCHYCL